MINLPVMEAVHVDGYAMYPGTEERPGLRASFEPGITVVIGANGLGKSTLMNMMFRTLTGPYDIPNIKDGAALGSRNLEVKKIAPWDVQAFGLRVSDAAAGATVRVSFAVGEDKYEVTRSLEDLALKSVAMNGETIPVSSEEEYQRAMTAAANVSTFGEWVLTLRLLVFYFDERRSLIWDRSAQLQLLRILFLSPGASVEWSQHFREIVELDSLVRNMTYTLNKEAKLVARQQVKLGRAPELLQELKLLTAIQDDEGGKLERFADELVVATQERDQARLADLRAEQALETARRALEREELRWIDRAFPDASATSRYIVAQLLSEETCLTCSSHVPEFAQELRNRVSRAACPVCASGFANPEGNQSTAATVEKLARNESAARSHLEHTTRRRENAELAYGGLVDKIAELNEATSRRAQRISEIERQLPPEEASVRSRETGLEADRSRLAVHRERLARLRSDFEARQRGVNAVIAEAVDATSGAFDRYASRFLFEDCRLSWTVYQDRIGEGGLLIDFPAFELDMTGANFTSPVRRTEAQQVSESQREFVDLSFRMALVSVAAGNAGSIIIDAPESSLDAVFVTQAAGVLTDFATSGPDTRLIMTSNLVDGDLIPEILARSRVRGPESERVVDLLTIATPTAATFAMHDEYIAIKDRVFARAREKQDA